MRTFLTPALAALLIGAATVTGTGSWAAGLDASVNAGQVAMGDRFQLTLSTSGQGGATPDLSPLGKDFDVLGTSQSMQTQVINGRMSQSQSWIVTLSPKREGAVTIPEIHAGQLSSEPVEIKVLDASQLPKLQGADGIALTATIEDGNHYVFQEIPVTVRIETAVPLQKARLIPPTGDFELTQTGEDRTGQITRDGQAVNVVERQYMLRPQSEGALTLAPFTLRGAVEDPTARRRDPFASMGFSSAFGNMGARFNSPFDRMFNPGKPFVARSDALTLDIAANPNAGTSEWFLPAKAVELASTWTPANPTFREGEAVTRRISLRALGARPEQLPDLALDAPDGVRFYLDDTVSDLVETPDGTVAQRDFVVDVVPTRGGEVVLPEISVEWLDTASGETKTAVLPAETISVDGTVTAAAKQAAPVTPATAPEPAGTGETGETTSFWPHFLAVGGSALLLGAGGVMLWRRRGLAKRASKPGLWRRDYAASLRQAARNGDARGFYKAALDWRAELSARGTVPPGYDATLRQIEPRLFGNATHDSALPLKALARKLTRAMKTADKAARKTRRDDQLPGLYPSARHVS